MTNLIIRWSLAALSFSLSVFGPILAAAAIRYVRDKHWLALTDAQETNLQHAIWRAISYADEQAFKAAKAGGTLSSQAKMDLALEVVRAALPAIDEDAVRVRIESSLGNGRRVERTVKPDATAQTSLPLT